MGSCAAPSAKGDDKFITTDYLQQCPREQELEAKRQRQADLKEIKQLKRELRQKEKALAETAAILVLRKKLNALWENDHEDD
ncbi:hypothetical protein JNS11_26045 [Klebsiella pneumoniae]|nr:hypothetical protein [Klebsiella pneumoniae]